MSFFARHLSRLRRTEDGFSLIETVVALGVLFVSLLVLARTAAVGFTDIAMSRQRQQANQLANQVLEQVRGLSYARVGEGLQTSDLAGDSSIITTCPDGAYYLACPSTDPDAEKIVHSENPPDDVPLMPHRRTFDADEGYTSTYTVSVYVTEAKLVPTAGAFRVTAHVSWDPAQRSGVNNFVTTQSLLYTPEGTTDATTGGGTDPFFYGTGSIGRGPVTLTPNPGVAGGVGLQGLSSWDSMTVNLYGLESSLQQQALTRAESKVVLTGASKVVSGVETLAGGDTAEAIADNDPATTPGTSSAPSSLMQSTVTSEISGGGNSIEAEAASGSLTPPCTRPSGLVWGTGVETGGLSSSSITVNGGFAPWGGMFSVNGATNGPAVDSAVARTGNYSLKIVSTATTAPYARYFAGTALTGTVVRFSFRFASLPSADQPSLMSIDNLSPLGTRDLRLRYHTSSQRLGLGFQDANNAPVGVVDGPVIQAATWYSIDIKVNWATNPHVAEWMVDGIPQPTTTNPQAASTTQGVRFGPQMGIASQVWTANYDDMLVSTNLADYPLPDMRAKLLKPNGMGTNVGATSFQNNDSTAINATSWQRLDEVPASASTDWVKQISNGGSNYLEITFEDPPAEETCIAAVRAVFSQHDAGTQAHNMKGIIVDGSTQSCILVADGTCNPRATATTTLWSYSGPVTPAADPWTHAAVSGLVARLGYSTDATPNPFWDSVHLEYLASPMTGGGGEGDAGTETGSTTSTTAANAATPCGTPTQIDGRACSYAREDYSTAGPPHLSLKVGTTGSDSAMARLYRFSPSTAPGSTSYVWGRRTAGGGGVGTVKQTVVRYPGKHTFAPLPTFIGGSPAGWQGYWFKYDAGTSASSVTAEAGIGAGPPTFTSAGTISYWTGAGYASMAPPAAGGDIPLVPVDFTSGGYRIQISGTLGTSPSFTSQVPAGASGTADRNEARATLGAPVTGTFTYKTTVAATGEVLADLTMSVDLGALTATARYAP